MFYVCMSVLEACSEAVVWPPFSLFDQFHFVHKILFVSVSVLNAVHFRVHRSRRIRRV